MSQMRFLIVACILCMSCGNVLSQEDSWYQIASPTMNKLNEIHFPSDQVGYIVGDNATILKSTDGGMTWSELPPTGIQFNSSTNFLDVEFLNEDTGYLVLEFYGVYKTIDGGNSWFSIGGDLSASICKPTEIYVKGEDHFLVGGAFCFGGAKIWEYENTMWTDRPINYFSLDMDLYINDIDFLDDSIGLAAMSSELLLRTADGGEHWDTIRPYNFEGSNLSMNAVMMVDQQRAYAANDLGSVPGGGNVANHGLLISQDAGYSFTEDMQSATFYYPEFNALCKAQNGDFYAGAKMSSNGGAQVQGHNGFVFERPVALCFPSEWCSTPVKQEINDMTSYGNDVTFGIGDSGYIIVNTPPLNASVGESKVHSLTLSPVPASTELMITGEALIEEYHVYDLQGKELNVRMEKTNGSIRLDIADLSGGTYLLHLLSNGSWTQHKFLKGN